MKLRGKVWLFGSNVSTDEILPGRYLDRSSEEVGAFAMSGIDAEFVNKTARGDVIVAATNFGCGSSRETAPIAIQRAGIAAVIAESFARIFYRNAVNIGLPVLIVPSTKKILNGDKVEIDAEGREVRDLTNGETQSIQNLHGISWDILQKGGIINYTIARMNQTRPH